MVKNASWHISGGEDPETTKTALTVSFVVQMDRVALISFIFSRNQVQWINTYPFSIDYESYTINSPFSKRLDIKLIL